MPRMCCVPGCRGNYHYEETVSVFRFPKNAELQEKWLKAIARENYTIRNTSVVCEKHFSESLILRVDSARRDDGSLLQVKRRHPKLHPEAIPHIFNNRPASSNNFLQPRRRRRKRNRNPSCQADTKQDAGKKKKEAKNNERASKKSSPKVLETAAGLAEGGAISNNLLFEATENFMDDSSYHLVKQQIVRVKLANSVPKTVTEPFVSRVEIKREPVDYDDYANVNENYEEVLPCITPETTEALPVKIKEPKSEYEDVNKNSTAMSPPSTHATSTTEHSPLIKIKGQKSNDGGPIIIRACELMAHRDNDTNPDHNADSVILCTNVIKQEKLGAVTDIKVQGP